MIISQINFKYIFSHRISQNAIANFVRTILQIIIAFVCNYIIVRLATKQEIGLWALVFTFSTFLNLIDLGISQALIRYIANDETNTHKYFWVSFIFYLISGTIAIVFLFIIYLLFGHLFFKDVSPSAIFIIITLIGTHLSLLTSAFTNILNGKQLMIKSSTIEVFKSIAYYGIILTLFPQIGVISFAYATLGSSLFCLIISYFTVKKSTAIPYFSFDLAVFKKLFNFGIKTFGLAIINQLKGAWLPFLIQSMFGISYVAYTDFLTRIMGYFRQLLLSTVLPLLPAASALHAKNEKTKLKKLYRLSLPLLFIIGIIACLGLTLTIPYVVNFWLGPDYQPVIIISQILCWAVFFNLLSGPAVYILQAMNNQKPVLIFAFVTMLLFFAFTFIGGKFYGFNALFIGNVIAETIAVIYFLAWFKRKKLLDAKSYD